MRQMKKIKKIENFATAAEGFVFDFEGVTYKFTGNFAPANQIIGIAKYGRVSQPTTVMKEDEEGKNVRADVAVIPGAFKPPHRGHLAMVAEYSKWADRVVVFMSPLARKMPGVGEIAFDESYALWEKYLSAAGLTNVSVKESPVNSPVGAVFNFVANEDNNPDWAQPGETVILGVSTKGGDDSRFTADAQKYAGDDIIVLSGAEYAIDPNGPDFTDSRTGEPLSATGMREAIENQDVGSFEEYLPKELKGNAEVILKELFLPSTPLKTESTSELIFRMINEMSGVTAISGAVMANKPIKRSKKKRKKKEIEEQDDNYYNEVNRITDLVINRLKGINKQ